MSNRVTTASLTRRLGARLAIVVLVVLSVAAVWQSTAPAASSKSGRVHEHHWTKAQVAQFEQDAASYVLRRATARATAARMRKYRYGSRTLRKGMTGADVMKLQKYLTGLAFPTSADGVFGSGTKRAVIGLERSRQAKVDGIVPGKQARKIRAAAKKRRTAAGASSGQVFPIKGVHTFGGASARFGAPRNGHTHQGQDVFATCGTPLVASEGGTVRVKQYQASGAGHYIVIRGAATGEDYVYMHMTTAFAGVVGQIVTTGQQIGTVGASGNATGCHLHFELWTVPGWYLGGAPYDPLPKLQLWDTYS